MKKLGVEDIITGIAFIVLGLPGACDNKMYYKKFPVMYPERIGWALIVLGIGIPIAAYIMRSRQGKDK